MRNKPRFYCLQLTDEERAIFAETAKTLRLDNERLASEARVDETVAEYRKRAELWGRLEYERGEEDLLSLATSRLRAWYYSRVADLAEDIVRACVAGEVDDLGDYLHETVDGTDLATYTYKAKACLLASDNEDAYADEYGAPALSAEAAAFMAIRADVLQRIEAGFDTAGGLAVPEGFNPWDPETWTVAKHESEVGS